MDKIQLFYVQSHVHTKSPEELAADLNVPVADVQAAIASLRPPKPNYFSEQAGSVVMTAAQSKVADDMPKVSPKAALKKYAIDPTQPVY